MNWPKAVLWYLAIALVVCFFRLGSAGAIHNEGIIADGARHMQRTGDLLVPHLYGEPYTYKPPLTNWLVLAGFELTGRENTWTMRVPIVLFALLMGLAVLVGVGRICNPRLGLISALATITTGLSLEKMRFAEYDLPLAAGVGVAVVAASTALVSTRPRVATWLVCYFGLAIGFLAKGAPALMIFAPGLVLAARMTGRLRELAAPRHLAGAALFVLAIGLYLGLASSGGPEGLLAQPLAEARARGLEWDWRALGTTALKPLAVGAAFLPWTVFLPIAVLGLRRAAGDEPAIRLLRSGLGFAAGGLLGFLIVPTFEIRYFYPLAVPIGIVCGLIAGNGIGLPRGLETAGRRAALVSSGLLALATLGVGIRLASGIDRLILVVFATGALVALAGFAAGRPPRMSASAVAIVGALCLWATYVFVLFPRRAETRTLDRAAAELAPLVGEDAWFWIPPSADDQESLLLFHLDRPAVRLRPGQSVPLPGSLALLSPEQLRDIEAGPGRSWVEVARAGNARRVLILSRLELVTCAPLPAVFEQRVTDLHLGLLGRAPTTVETQEMGARLIAGTPLSELGRQLIASPEFAERKAGASDEELVEGIFRALLGRDPGPEGLSTTLGPLRRGRLHVRVAYILTSDEYLVRHPYCGKL